MEFHRRDGFSRDVAFEIDYGKSKDNVNEIEIIGSAHQRIFEKHNEDVGSEMTISHDTKSKSLYERKLFQFDVGSPPLNKRSRNIDCSKFIENKFYDLTLLSNGNYTHMTEELGELTPNGQDEITVASKEEHGQSATFPNPMNEQCIEFLTEKGGENCYSIGEESHEDRKSEAICLVPGFGSKCILKSSNWKTRLCNKWEINGWCTFGDKCHYAHGSSELRGYDGRLVNKETDNRSTLDAKHTASPATASVSSTGAGAHVPCVPRSNRVGVRLQRLPTTMEVPTRRWKGPNKISKIYGDWIDDLQ